MKYFEDSLDVLNLAEVPQSTNYYKAIENEYMHRLALDTIEKNGLSLVRFYFKSNRKGTQVIGIYELDCGDNLFNGMLGWRNSYDKTKSAAIVSGSTVNICSNGCIVGEMQFVHKHNGDVLDLLPEMFDKQIKKVSNCVHESRVLFNSFSTRSITDWLRNAILGNLFMRNIISVQQLSLVKNQYDTPDYDYGYPETLWELFNHCTFALKKTHPTRFFETHQKLRDYLESV